jgi:hypothetical protein
MGIREPAFWKGRPVQVEPNADAPEYYDVTDLDGRTFQVPGSELKDLGGLLPDMAWIYAKAKQS